MATKVLAGSQRHSLPRILSSYQPTGEQFHNTCYRRRRGRHQLRCIGLDAKQWLFTQWWDPACACKVRIGPYFSSQSKDLTEETKARMWILLTLRQANNLRPFESKESTYREKSDCEKINLKLQMLSRQCDSRNPFGRKKGNSEQISLHGNPWNRSKELASGHLRSVCFQKDFSQVPC